MTLVKVILYLKSNLGSGKALKAAIPVKNYSCIVHISSICSCFCWALTAAQQDLNMLAGTLSQKFISCAAVLCFVFREWPWFDVVEYHAQQGRIQTTSQLPHILNKDSPMWSISFFSNTDFINSFFIRVSQLLDIM